MIPFCSRDHSPFDDLNNARAHVLSWTFSGKESIPVYTTGTLEIGVALREKVDSFTVSAPHNRFWSDTTVKRASPDEMLDAQAFTFSISFYDTGMETVSVRTHRVSGGMVAENLVIRTTLPLRQSDVSGFYGDTILLSTPRVNDRNVFYQWDFGPGRLVKSMGDSAFAVLVDGSASGTATVKVTDPSGDHATPARTFSYTLNDTAHPVITCVNDFLRGDTLVTADSVLAFKAFIVNYRDRSADSCWVNQSAFDIAYPQSHLYIKLFKDLSVHTRQAGPLKITVGAIGNKQKPVTTQRIFWAIFDPQGGVSNPDASIEFVVPLKDSTRTANRIFQIFGTAENVRGDSMVLRVRVNDSAYSAPCIVSGPSGVFGWRVHLDSLVNAITVTALDASGSRMLAQKRVIVLLDSTLQENVKPVIWEITADGKPADGLITQQATVDLQVIAFDEGSGIQAVTIGGTSVAPDSSGYVWRQSIGPLVHSPAGNTVVVTAEDRDHNRIDDTITIFRNTAPALDSGTIVPATVYVGTTYTFRIVGKDADNDPVIVRKTLASGAMTVSSNGLVSWAPGVPDVGADSLTVVLDDGYETSGPFFWSISCIDTSKPAAPVRFTTREGVFPPVLLAGVDTLSLTLVTNGASGTGLVYSAALTDRFPQTVLFSNVSSPKLVWAPSAADTGDRKLSITVGNGSQNFDTINPLIRVVAPNRYPCHLSYTFTGTTTPAGELDLFSRAAPETLSFVIHDSDDALTEKYSVAISQNAVRSVAVLNKRDFMIVVRPDSARELDTLLVSIHDVTGTSDSETFVIRNKSSVLGPHSQKLYLNTTAAGANVAGTVIDFPVLVRLNSSNFNFSQAYANGDDIRFAKANGFPLDFQIERWDQALALAEIWVKADTVYGNDSIRYIVMSWGVPSSGLSAVSHNVFDTANGFQGVWHLNDPVSGPVKDATINGYDGTVINATAQTSVTSIVGSGRAFAAGGSGYVLVPSTATSKLNFPENGMYAISAWVYLDMLDGGSHAIATKGDQQYNLEVFQNRWEFAEYKSAQNWELSSMPASAGQWTFVTGVRNKTRQYLYVNGQCVDSMIENQFKAGVYRNTGYNVMFGKTDGVTQPDFPYYFHGTLDEIRMSSRALSAGWIKLCYMNQKAVDALVVFK